MKARIAIRVKRTHGEAVVVDLRIESDDLSKRACVANLLDEREPFLKSVGAHGTIPIKKLIGVGAVRARCLVVVMSSTFPFPPPVAGNSDCL